MSVESDPQLL